MKDGIPQHFWTGQLMFTLGNVPTISETRDGGATWTHTTIPQSGSGVWQLKYDQSSGLLLAAISSGLFALETKLAVNDPKPAVPFESAKAALHLVRTRAGNTSLTWSADLNAGQLCITDILGRTIRRMDINGLTEMPLSSEIAGAGCYIITVTTHSGKQHSVKWIADD
jgi:hypothetical protein